MISFLYITWNLCWGGFLLFQLCLSVLLLLLGSLSLSFYFQNRFSKWKYSHKKNLKTKSKSWPLWRLTSTTQCKEIYLKICKCKREFFFKFQTWIKFSEQFFCISDATSYQLPTSKLFPQCIESMKQVCRLAAFIFSYISHKYFSLLFCVFYQ